MNNYLEDVNRKRQEAKERLEKERAQKNILDTTKVSADKVAAEVARQGAKNRTTLQKVNIQNPDLAKTQDIDKVIAELKETQLAALLGGQNKPSVILADSTDLGVKVSELGDRITSALENAKSDTSQLEVIKSLANEYKSFVSVLSKTVSESQSATTKAIKELEKSLNSKDFKPTVNVPEPKVEIQPFDAKPVTDALSKLEQAIKNNKISIPKQDFSSLDTNIQAVTKAIQSLSFPVPNYILPYQDPTTGKATQVVLTSNGKIPVDATFTGDLSVTQVGIENVAETKINPSTEEKQDDIITAIENISVSTDGLTDTELRASPVVVDLGANNDVTVTGTVTANLGAVDNAVLDQIELNQDSQTALLTTIDGDTGAIATDVAAIETLLTTIEGNQLPDGHNVTVDNASIAVTGTFWQATQPVSGTVTANLSATDNQVLDDIKVDTEAIETAVEAIQAAQLPDGHNVTVDNASIAVTNDALTELASAINSNLVDVNIVSGAGSGGTAAADDADFTAGTTQGTPAMGVYESSPTSVTDGDLGTVGITQTRRLKTSATVDAALPAGDNNIGNVDVVTMPTVTVQATNLDVRDIDAASDDITVHGDVGVIDQFDLTNSNPAAVAIVDGDGTQITSFGGGTQYTEGDTDASLTGTVAMAEGPDDTATALQVDASGNLKVNLSVDDTSLLSDIVNGLDDQLGVYSELDSPAAGNDLALPIAGVRRDADTSLVDTDGDLAPFLVNANGALKVEVFSGETLPVSGTVTANLSATDNQVLDDIDAVLDTIKVDTEAIETAVEAIQAAQLPDGHNVTIDNPGDIGGGVQYTEGDEDATITGTAMMMEVAADIVEPVQGTVADGLLVNLGANNDVTVSGVSTSAKQDTIIGHVDGIEALLGTIDSDTGNLPTIETNTDFGTVVGGGAEASALRVTIANDSTGVVSVDDNGSTISIDDGGSTISVDGTVTANLSATDNQVLDNIEAGIDELKTSIVLASGTNGIGKLTANSGVDIGDVDVTSISAGTNAIGNVGLIGRTTGGMTIFRSIDLDETEEEVKGSAGQVFSISAFNTTAAPLYLKLYNATAANVTVGSTAPVLTFVIPGNADSDGAGFVWNNDIGFAFGTAITAAVTTGVADADTGAPGANAAIVNIGYA